MSETTIDEIGLLFDRHWLEQEQLHKHSIINILETIIPLINYLDMGILMELSMHHRLSTGKLT